MRGMISNMITIRKMMNTTLTTLYDRGVDGWVSADSSGDAEFRDAFGTWMSFEAD